MAPLIWADPELEEGRILDLIALMETEVIVASRKPQPLIRSPAIVNVEEFAKGSALLAAVGRIDYQGASGPINFNVKGSPTNGTFQWWQIQDGVVKILETIPFCGD